MAGAKRFAILLCVLSSICQLSQHGEALLSNIARTRVPAVYDDGLYSIHPIRVDETYGGWNGDVTSSTQYWDDENSNNNHNNPYDYSGVHQQRQHSYYEDTLRDRCFDETSQYNELNNQNNESRSGYNNNFNGDSQDEYSAYGYEQHDSRNEDCLEYNYENNNEQYFFENGQKSSDYKDAYQVPGSETNGSQYNDENNTYRSYNQEEHAGATIANVQGSSDSQQHIEDETRFYAMGRNNEAYYDNNDSQQQLYHGDERALQQRNSELRAEERSLRPPQEGVRNRKPLFGSNIVSPMNFFLDDFRFGDSLFDSVLGNRFPSSPMMELFAPFGSMRQRRMARRRSGRSPLSSFFLDMRFPDRMISPFSMFDRSIDEKYQSMMRKSMGPGPMMADPMSQKRILENAEYYLNGDIACASALGTPVRIGPVISQSSSASSCVINGRQMRQQQTELQVSVQGSHGGGVLRVVATEESRIQNMVLSVADRGGYPREIQVQLSPLCGEVNMNDGSTSSSTESKIVDAEIVSKNER